MFSFFMFFLVARSYYSSKGPRYEYQGPRYYVANVPRWHLNHASSRGACHDTGERPRGTTRPGSASARNSRGGGCGVPSGRSGRNAAGGTSRPRRCCVHRPMRSPRKASESHVFQIVKARCNRSRMGVLMGRMILSRSHV